MRMKTIEERAEEYSNKRVEYSQEESRIAKTAFETGAEEILEELKRTILVSEPGFLEGNLKILIKELSY